MTKRPPAPPPAPRRKAPRSAFRAGDGRRRGPVPVTREQLLARRAERLALAAAADDMRIGIAEALTYAPAVIAEMARRALSPGASDERLMLFGREVTTLARTVLELEVARSRPAGGPSVQILNAAVSPEQVAAMLAGLAQVPPLPAPDAAQASPGDPGEALAPAPVPGPQAPLDRAS